MTRLELRVTIAGLLAATVMLGAVSDVTEVEPRRWDLPVRRRMIIRGDRRGKDGDGELNRRTGRGLRP